MISYMKSKIFWEIKMKLFKFFWLVIIILFLMVGCNVQNQSQSKETLGVITDLIFFLPDEEATWVYKGTGVYHHEMTIEDIIFSDQSIDYKIKGEILSDNKNSNYDDYLTEIRYIISRKGWRQEIKQSKLLDSKYKGIYILKFPIEVNNTWQETVLDFDGKQQSIIGQIEAIDFINNAKVITVKYNEKNSDYYEIRKITEGKGIIEFEQNIKMNAYDHTLGYSLENFYNSEESIKSKVKTFLISYNNAWEKYYNNNDLEILDYVDKSSEIFSSVTSFIKKDDTKIVFLDLSVASIKVEENLFEIVVDESFSIRKNGGEFIQSNKRKYTLMKRDESFKILKIE